jgi:hypothetical protein
VAFTHDVPGIFTKDAPEIFTKDVPVIFSQDVPLSDMEIGIILQANPKGARRQHVRKKVTANGHSRNCASRARRTK